MRQALWPLLLALASLSLLGAAQCSAVDRDRLIDFAKTWAEIHGVIDEDGKPTVDAVSRAALGSSTGDPRTDAALDAGGVVKNIKEAEEEAGKAQEALRQNDPDTAKKHLDSAISKRPEDWSYWNQRAVVMLEKTGKSNYDFGEAEHLAQTDDAVLQRELDLARRLEESIQRQQRSGLPWCQSYTKLDNAYYEASVHARDRELSQRYVERQKDAVRRSDSRFGFCKNPSSA